jgi:hypothetical protein
VRVVYGITQKESEQGQNLTSLRHIYLFPTAMGYTEAARLRMDPQSPALLEVGGGPVGLDEGPGLLLDPAGQRELDLGVVSLGEQGPAALAGGHSLAADDLDGMSSGPAIDGS